jgi:hypothetical protein
VRRATLVVAPLLTLVLLGCVDNSNPSDGTPRAAEPQLDSRLRSLGAGVLELALDPGQTRDLDPVNMALNLGRTPPACADFVLAFTWQVRFPQPAGDAKVHFTGQRMGGTFEVGGPSPAGAGTVGCALLQASNEGTAPLVVELRFVVATSRP